MARHKKMDKLSRWACEALALGMRYGDYVAKYHPPGSAPAPVKEKPKVGTTHTCEYCGEEFTQYDKVRRKYCCEAHREAAYRKQIAKPQERVKTCPVCGKEFVAESFRIKYCSPFCSRVVHTERVREYRHRRAAKGG